MSINTIIAEKTSDDKTLLDLMNREQAVRHVKREVFKTNLEAIQNQQPVISISQDNYKYFDLKNQKFIPQRLGEEILSILNLKKNSNEALFYLDEGIFKPAEQTVKQLCSQLLGDKYTQWHERDTLSYLKSFLPETTGSGKKFPKLTCLAVVKSEEVSWLWEPYLPLGKISMLEGDPGNGKTFVALALAAAVSNGWPLLDRLGNMTQHVKQGRVLYLTCEDGLGDTLKPRLEKMGANLDNIMALEGAYKPGDDNISAVSLQDDEILRNAFEMVEPSLVIIDPIQGYLGPGANMNRAEEVRPLLSMLGRLAEEFKCAIIIIRHLTKGGKDKAGYRGMGSIDFTAAARSALLVGKDPDNESERVIVQTKSSLAEAGKTVAFTITDGKFEWVGHTEVTAAQVLAPEKVEETDEEERNPFKEARKYLVDTLMEGPKPAKEILEGVKYSGFSKRTLDKAKSSLKIKSYPVINNEGKKNWYWSFPTDSEIEETN